MWLLTRKRKDEAISSLRWLRGWVPAEEVSEEFHYLELYCQESKNDLENGRVTKTKESSGYTSVPG